MNGRSGGGLGGKVLIERVNLSKLNRITKEAEGLLLVEVVGIVEQSSEAVKLLLGRFDLSASVVNGVQNGIDTSVRRTS
jgi:hypothetical protein